MVIQYIVARPILDLCDEVVWRLGTQIYNIWWEQEVLDLLYLLDHLHHVRDIINFACIYSATVTKSKSFIPVNGSHVLLLVSHNIRSS